MAKRVTNEEVCKLFPKSTGIDFEGFITTANIMVNKLVTDCGSDFEADQLAEIEKYLAGHFAAVSHPKLAKTHERFEQYSVTFSRGGGNNKEGIMSTQYGQTANTLSCGCLANLDKIPITAQAAGGEIYNE